MSYQQTVQEHLRITILKMLVDDPDYTMNDSIITDLMPDFGHSPSRDQVRTELSWLKDQGLVQYDNHPRIIIASLTQRGADVALGRTTVPGVKRPSPGV
jgi:Fe2+ or Zn2+ uptake regulation protein